MCMTRIDESGRLLVVDSIIKSAIEESNVDVQLSDRPSTGDSNTKNDSYSRMFDNWAKCLIVVDERPLRVTTDNPTSFVAGQGAIRVELVFEHPFVGDNISTKGP